MAIVNPSLLPGFDLNSTNSSSPSAGLQNDGYAFGDIPASSNHNYMFKQLYEYLNFLKDNGISRWDAATTYKKQAMTVRNEIIFLSKADGNISNDPLTTPAQWLSLTDWVYAPLKTTAITNAGSKSTLTVAPYFGTVASLKDSHTYYIRIETGTIDFPTNVEINISGLGSLPATIYLPTLNTQTGHIIAVQYIAEVGSERFVQAGKKTVGLGQVDNTSDLNKPISTATQAALNAKQNIIDMLFLVDNIGGSSVANTWSKRNIDAIIKNTITGSSVDVSADTFTLPSGTYDVVAHCPAYRCDGHIARLYNITDGQEQSGTKGTSQWSGSSYNEQAISVVQGRFTIASPKVFRIEHNAKLNAANGFGISHGIVGVQDIFMTVIIYKVG